MQRIQLAALVGGMVAIVLSDSVVGLCARAAVAAPLYWCGLIDIETATSFANPYGRG